MEINHGLPSGIKRPVQHKAASVPRLGLLPEGIKAHPFFQVIADVEILLRHLPVQDVGSD